MIHPNPPSSYFRRLPACLALFLCFPNQHAAADSLYEARKKADPPAVYQDQNLTGIDFPVGPVGGSLIRMNGKAERAWWQIFHNYEQRKDSGVVPNSFFAIRTKAGDATQVRALQTSAVGPFPAMQSLTFSGEFPFGWYSFKDEKLPVQVTLEAYNPLIPMDLKNSAIPCAIFRIKVSNPSAAPVEVSLLATQQNAVGLSGYDTIGWPNQRQNPGYGSNRNQVVTEKGRTGVALTGPSGSMHLSAHADAVSAIAFWQGLPSLLADFESDGTWDTSTANWSSPTTWTNGDDAVFSNTASPTTVTLSSGLTAGSVKIGNGGNNANYTFTGGSLTATSFTQEGNGGPAESFYATTTLNNTSLSVTSPGTPRAPLRTIQRAADLAQPSDTVTLKVWPLTVGKKALLTTFPVRADDLAAPVPEPALLPNSGI